jgi:hypothetical protein
MSGTLLTCKRLKSASTRFQACLKDCQTICQFVDRLPSLRSSDVRTQQELPHFRRYSRYQISHRKQFRRGFCTRNAPSADPQGLGGRDESSDVFGRLASLYRISKWSLQESEQTSQFLDGQDCTLSSNGSGQQLASALLLTLGEAEESVQKEAALRAFSAIPPLAASLPVFSWLAQSNDTTPLLQLFRRARATVQANIGSLNLSQLSLVIAASARLHRYSLYSVRKRTAPAASPLQAGHASELGLDSLGTARNCLRAFRDTFHSEAGPNHLQNRPDLVAEIMLSLSVFAHRKDAALVTRVARFHSTRGPYLDTEDGSRYSQQERRDFGDFLIQMINSAIQKVDRPSGQADKDAFVLRTTMASLALLPATGKLMRSIWIVRGAAKRRSR